MLLQNFNLKYKSLNLDYLKHIIKFMLAQGLS